MPFGKHRGQPLTDIPTSYLAWAVRTCDLSEWLREAVVAELKRRGVRCGDPASDAPPAAAPVKWDGLVSRWYRELTLKWHPDKGGTKEAMQAVNDAHDGLRKMLQEAGA
jgi:hypothetical protein